MKKLLLTSALLMALLPTIAHAGLMINVQTSIQQYRQGNEFVRGFFVGIVTTQVAVMQNEDTFCSEGKTRQELTDNVVDMLEGMPQFHKKPTVHMYVMAATITLYKCAEEKL